HTDDVPNEIPEPRKGKRVRKPKLYGSDFQLYLVEGSRDQVGSQYSYCYSIEEDPRTYNEAMQSRDAVWKEAIDDEIAIHNLVIHQMDVKTTFLNGDLDEEVYMKQPEGFVMPGKEHKVCKLVKSLYGLKQAPKQWHQKFNEVVSSSGFHLNQSDKCVYSKFDNSGKGVIICLYVDDMLIFGTDQNQVDKTMKFLSSRFSMKDMGEADVILGIKRENKGIVTTQSHYIEKILKKFNHEDCSPVIQMLDKSCGRFIFYEWMGVPTWRRCHFMGFQEACITGSTMESEFVALAAPGKEAEWLRNLIHEIPIWPKPIAPISIRCDSAPTMARAHSQIYNGKSRHLGVRHSMVRELIRNGVISIEFVRTQHNLADHLMKGLAKDGIKVQINLLPM
nr:zinc finger, CCHC-type [Tanacetum cinerariifolium]